MPEDGEGYPNTLREMTKDYHLMYKKMLKTGVDFAGSKEMDKLAR